MTIGFSMKKNSILLICLVFFTAFLFSNSPFKLGVYLDGLTVQMVRSDGPAGGLIKRGDEILAVRRLSDEEKTREKNYTGKSLTVTDPIPAQDLLETNLELDAVLKTVNPGDVVLVWVNRGGQVKKVYIPSEKTLPEAPTVFVDTGQHRSFITKIDILEGENILVTASKDKTLKAFDLETGELIRTFYPPFGTGKEGELISVSISPKTKDIACGAWLNSWEQGGVIYIFDFDTGRIKHTLRIPNVSHHMQYSNSGKYLVVSLAWGNGVQLYDGETLQLLDHAQQFWTATSYWCDISRDEQRIIAGSKANGLYLYAIQDEKLNLIKHESRYAGRTIYNSVFSNDGQRIALTFLDENTNAIEILSSHTLEPLYSLNTKGIEDKLFSVAWTADDKQIVAAGQNENRKTSLYTWEYAGRGKREQIPLNTEWIDHIRAYRDGIVYASYDPVWGVVADGKAVYRNQSSCVDARDFARQLEIDPSGTLIKYTNSTTDKRMVFDVLNRRLTEEAYFPGHFEYLPPITSALNIANWKDSTQLMLDGFYLAKDELEKSKVLAINPADDSFLIGTEWHLICYDSLGSVQWQQPAPSITYYVNTVNAGKQYVALFGDGTMRWYRASDGENLLNLYLDRQTDEWILWTQNGYYACSKNMDEQLKWRINTDKDNASDVYPFSRYSEAFHDTLLTILTLFENKTDMEILYERDQRVKRIDDFEKPPRINKVSISEQEGEWIKLLLETDSIQTCHPLIYINAKKQNDVNYSVKGTTISAQTQLAGGTNQLTVQLQTEQGIKSNPHFLTLNGPKAETIHRDLYLLAIGVNDYLNHQPLNYCINDAQQTAQQFRTIRASIDKNHHVAIITDKGFNEQAITGYIDSVKDIIGKDDIFVFYYSGHGISHAQSNRYGFSMIHANGDYLTFETLQKHLEKIRAQNMILLIDACHSGVLADTVIRGVFEEDLYSLNEKTGINVFTSSQSREASTEWETLEHGLFTYTLLNSFYSLDDPLISVHEIAANIKNQAEHLAGQLNTTPVYPKILLTGYDFVIGEK